MVSVLRQLQAEWNSLVPAAQAAGIRRVRTLNAPLETIAHRRAKVEWLRQQLGIASGAVPASTSFAFDGMSFGVELEFYLPRNLSRAALVALLNDAGVACRDEGYNHITGASWKLVSDGSLGDYVRGCELVSPALRGEEGFQQLRIACRVLTEARCTVKRRCGFHVHVGFATERVQTAAYLVQNYASNQSVIDSFLAPSRRGNSNPFCQDVRCLSSITVAQNMDDVLRGAYQSSNRAAVRGHMRYRKLNVMSYLQHSTIEFRHHQGTVEAHKVENWVKFCLRMVLRARNGALPYCSSLEQLMDELQATPAERSYFISRRNHFNPVAQQQAA